MLEVSTLRSPSTAGNHHAGFPTSDCCEDDDDFMVVDDNLLDYIDFTSCDVVPSFFDADGDILPDLEVDPTELLAEFEDHHDGGAAATETKPPDDDDDDVASPQGHNNNKEDELAVVGSEEKKDEKRRLLEEEEEEEEGQQQQKKNGGGDEVLSAVTTEDDSAAAVAAAAAGSSDTSKSSASAEGQSKKMKPSKNCHGNKKKGKVDWTPELHRKFVQAVEQLGIDKAVPSRILEIMGIEGLTRHNIASHLQKYRSHRKHLMAREAEAATWAQKRQMYAAVAASSGGQVAGAPRTKNDMPAAAGPQWVVPTIGFPPPPGVAPPFGRPLHVWGHAVEAAAAPMLPVWPQHLAPPRPWAPPVVDPAFWHQQYNAARKWGPQAVTQGSPPPMPPAAMLPRFHAPPPVPGMMPRPMYRPIPPPPTGSKLASLQLQLDAHPSKESIDAAIGDVLVKPWLPLRLGLKPPSLHSVMSELHKQGIPNIPPAAITGG